MKTPSWFLFFAVPFLVLGFLGMLQVHSLFSTELPEPDWAKFAHVTGIVGNFIGGIFLCFRKKIAIWFLVVSVIGFLTHRMWLFLLSDIVESLAPYAYVTLFLSSILGVIAIVILIKGRKSGWVS